MGIKDWFGRGPKDYNEQLIQEAEAQRASQDQRKAKPSKPPKPAESGWSGGDSGPPPAAPPEVHTELATPVVALVAAGKKIEAVKFYREATGLGLKESLDAVEALIAGGTVADAGPLAPLAPPGTDAEVVALLAQKKKIEAIKLYREIHDVGLKEALDAVEAMERRS